MAATENIQLNVTGNANEQLERINRNVQKVNNSFKKMGEDVGVLNGVFGRLAGIIAGLGIAAFGQRMLQAADDVADLSEAIGVTIGEIKNLQAAFEASGGTAEGATMAYTRLSKAVAEARGNNEGLRKKFEELGVTQQMLAQNNLSQIMQQVNTGMAGLGASTDKTALSMELLGKANNTLNFEKVNAELAINRQRYQELEPFIKQQADLFENIRLIGKQYSEELTKGTGGLIGMFAELTANTKAIAEALADLTKILGFALATWFIFTKAIPALTGGMNVLQKVLTGTTSVFAAFGKDIKGIVTSMGAMFTATGKITTAAGGAVTIFTRMRQVLFSLAAILKGFLALAFRLAGWVGIIITVAQAIDFLTKRFLGFSIVDWAMGKIEMLWGKLKQFAQWLGIMDKEAPKPAQAPAAAPPAVPSAAGAGGGMAPGSLVDTTKKLRSSIQDITKAYRDQALQRVTALQLELKYMGMSEDQVELAKAQADIERERNITLEDLAKKEQEIRDDTERTKASKQALLAEIYRQRDAINVVAEEERRATEEAIKAIQARRLEQEKLLNALELTKIAMDNQQALKTLQDELSLVGLYGDKLQDRQTQLQVEQELQGKLLEIEKKKLDLENQRAKLGEDRFRQEMSHLSAQEAEARKYADTRLKGERAVIDAQRALRDNEKLAVGQRLEEIARSIDPAVIAVKQLDSVFGNMEQAIDSFVQTGKFKFKDFAASVIRDLIAIELKAQATALLRSVIGSIFKIPGLAAGGPAKANQPYIVGEKGPELFMPNTSGTVVPNDKLSKGGTNSLAAPITNNYITNNINALDAKSVAQLFAENRKTLLGTVQMAQKEMPYGV